jgi:UBX domain-containing protein 1
MFFCFLSLLFVLCVLCSGMLVQDPTRRNDLDAIFEQARQMGAVQGLPPPFEDQSSSSRSFTGTGRLLSGETVPSAAPQRPAQVLHSINLWTNGFTVDDGSLRQYEDPENSDFVEVTSPLIFWMIMCK